MANKNNSKGIFGFRFANNGENGALVIDDLKDVTLGELAEGYSDTSENVGGKVIAWNGQLIVRPEFQRSFVVDGNIKWQSNLINSIVNNRPTGVMYFGLVNDGKDHKLYYNIDGQQRLMTALSFINGDLVLRMLKEDGTSEMVDFNRIPSDWQRKIKQYKPSIKVCLGTSEELLAWFKTINQPICELTAQELRNAAYNGVWCEIAKRAFSKSKTTEKPTITNGFVMKKGEVYHYDNYSMNLEPERQDVLEMALDWASRQVYGNDMDKDSRIENYMDEHRDDTNADDLISRYKAVIDWARKMFYAEYLDQKCAKNVDWGRLYATYGENEYDVEKLNADVDRYIMDEEVTANSAVFEYALMGCPIEKRNMLSLRAFKTPEKVKMYKMQGGIDPIDGLKYKLEDMDAHHIVAWENGGKTEIPNGVMISKANHKKVLHAELTYNSEQIRQMRDELIERVKSSKK